MATGRHLPLRLTVGIRDHFDSPTCAKTLACNALTKELGYPVTLHPEWPLLLAELGSLYKDKSLLASSIATVVECFSRALLDLITVDNADGGGGGGGFGADASGAGRGAGGGRGGSLTDEQWSNALLEGLNPTQCVHIAFEVRRDVREARMIFVKGNGTFMIQLPRAVLGERSEYIPLFKGQLVELFRTTEEGEGDSEGGNEGAAGSVEDGDGEGEAEETVAGDEWTDVVSERGIGGAHHTGPAHIGAANMTGDFRQQDFAFLPQRKVTNPPQREVTYLPDPNTLPNPEELLARPPYHLRVKDFHGTIIVECSHSPSLVVLEEWFRKWGKVNHNDTRRPPEVTTTLKPSSWGLSTRYEKLTLKRSANLHSTHDPSVTVVLALVEGTLGYQAVSVPDADTWIYRKDVEFKKI